MAALSGTILASRIVPSDSADAYATHDADYGRGGYRSVADIAERDAITEPRRKLGMKVFVNSEQKEYQLIGGIENANWIEVTGGSGSGVNTLSALTDTEIVTPVNGQALLYDEAGQKWINSDISSGGALTIADATDTTITTPTAGQVLTYDDVSGTWVNADAAAGSTDLTNYYTKDEVDGVISTTAINGLIPASANITLVTMTQMTDNSYSYSIPANTWVTVPYNFKHKDDLNQYNSVTGKVTIAESAYYLINAKIEPYGGNSMNAWTYYSITRNNTSAGDFINALYYDSELTTAPLGRDVTIPVYLLAGDTIQVNVKTAHSNPALRTGDDKEYSFGQSNFLSVVKLTGVATNVTYTGLNAYELAVQEGFVGTLNDWLLSINGNDGLSAYDVWLGLGNTGTEQQFIDSLKGMDGIDGINGTDGLSAYQVWLNLGNTGTEQDFIDSLKGDAGATGATGADGADGVGVPTGGTTGQILAKIDSADYNTTWIDAPTGGGSAEYPDMTGNAGKFLSNDGTNAIWDSIPSPTFVGLSELPAYEVGVEVLTAERWVNGKPLYRMTFSGTVGADDLTINTGLTGVEDCRVSDYVMFLTSGSAATEANSYYISDTNEIRMTCKTDGSTISVLYSDGSAIFNGSRYYVSILYTKTADTADSPVALIGGGEAIEAPAFSYDEELTTDRWTNGKPIYKKVIDFGALPNNANKTVDHGVANVETIWLDRANSFVSDSSGYIYGLEAATSVVSANWYGTATTTAVQIRTYTDRTTHTGTMTIRYTKTTDTAESPVALIRGGSGGGAEYPDMTGNAGKVLGTDGTNVSWVDNGDAVALNMRYGRAFLDMTTSPGAVGTSTDWLQTFDNNTIDSSQKLTDKRLLLKAGRLYKINGGIDYMTYSGNGGAFNTSFYVAKVSDGVFNLVAGTDAIAIPITATGHVSREARVEDAYIRPLEDSWLECRVTRNDVSGISLFRTEYTVTEYLNVTGEGAITLPSVTNQSGKFLSNNGTDIEWVKPEFNGLSELPAYDTNEVLTSERWIDGKPIYRKTINFGVLPNNTAKSVLHNILGLENIWINRGKSFIYLTATPSIAYGLELSINVLSATWHSYTNSSSVIIQTYSDRTNFSAIITVEYTKTTDTASSPVALVGSQYNISSTEYVLPYTRNGKVVYGMEVDCGAMPNAATKNIVIPNYSNSYNYEIVKFTASDATYHINVPIQWSSTTYIERWITRASGSITVVANFNASSLNGKCVLEYTKD